MTATYLRNNWYQAAWASELSEAPLARTLLDEPIVFFRTGAGIAALQDRCPHRFAPLSAGRFQGGTVTCGYHGLTFDGSGRCVHNPYGPITEPMKVRSYPVAERHSAIWIWMGAQERADEALIPDVSFIDRTSPTASSGYVGERLSFSSRSPIRCAPNEERSSSKRLPPKQNVLG